MVWELPLQLFYAISNIYPQFLQLVCIHSLVKTTKFILQCYNDAQTNQISIAMNVFLTGY